MIRKLVLFFSIFFGSLCFGLVFVVIFVNATELTCTLQSDEYSCDIRTLLLGRVETFEKHVEHVVDITVAEDGCFEGCSYRAEFVTSTGEQIPLTEVYTDKGPVIQQVDALRSQMVVLTDPITYRSELVWWELFLIGGLTLMTMLLSPLVFIQRR